MGEAALSIEESSTAALPRPALTLVELKAVGLELNAAGLDLNAAGERSLSDSEPNFLVQLGALFTPLTILLVMLQIFDGILTSAGVAAFGTMAEGNPLIRELMHYFGFIPAIFIAKSLSCVIIFILAYKALSMGWIRPVLRVVACIYIFGAIIPWTLILFGAIF